MLKKFVYDTMVDQQPSSVETEKVQRSGVYPCRNQAVPKCEESCKKDYDMIRSQIEKSEAPYGAYSKDSLDKKFCTVYGLKSSNEDHVRYIGQTTQLLRRRLADHLCAATHLNMDAYVYRWIRKNVRNGHTISIIPIEENCEFDTAEVKWINHYKQLYNDMTNTATGGGTGNLGIKLSEETKQKMRKPKSEATKQKMAAHPISKAALEALRRRSPGNTYSQGVRNRHAVLNESSVKEIRLLVSSGKSLSSIASLYGIKKAAVWKIKERKTWRHVY